MSLLANDFEKPARQIGVERFKRLVSDLRGFLISEVQTSYAEIEMGLGVAGFDLHRLFVSVDGFRPATELAESHPEVVMRLRPIRLELDRLQAGVDLFFKPLLVFISCAEIEPRVGEFRFEFY